MQLKNISIFNSPFFGEKFELDFSDKLNCLMGGRGTGKSTLLYFIWCALSDEPEESKAVNSLLRANLHNGTIKLTILGPDMKEYVVTKTLGVDSLIQQTAGTITLSSREFKSQFDPEIYPALKIEDIGRNSKDRLELIDKRVFEKVREIKSEIRECQITLDQNAELIRSENARILDCQKRLAEFSTAKSDLKAWKANKSDDLTGEEQKAIEDLDNADKIRNAEKRYKKNVISRLEETLSSLNELDDQVSRSSKANEVVSSFKNREILDAIAREFAKAAADVSISVSKLREMISTTIGKVEVLAQPLESIYAKDKADSIVLKQKLDKHREYISRYDILSRRVEELGLLNSEIKDLAEKQSKAKSSRLKLIEALNNKKKELFNLRKSTVDGLNSDLQGQVRIILSFGGITEPYESLLRDALKGSNMRYNTIIPYIVDNFTPDRFAAAIHERNADELCKISSIDAERSAALINNLYETREIYQIESLYVEDLPEFYLKVEQRDESGKVTREDFKKSDELSTGQRCTTVLPIIFAVSKNPLLIDQPEDNLDNEFINNTIREIIQSQKNHRQMIFITHNPNIPVVSDAEFNAFLHYENRTSSVHASGTVDEVKEQIVKLLEGGEKAFIIRQKLYKLDGK